MKKTSLILLSLLGVAAFGQQKNARIDTVSVYSQSMKKDIKNVVILPDEYNKKGSNDAWPVLYLLHGAGGWYANWIKRVENLPEYATEYKMIIVCPDGGPYSWYIDSPVDSTSCYETYITKELVSSIDSRYHTMADSKGRAIMGLSMGGQALWLAFRNQDVYGAAGSMSGAIDLSVMPGNNALRGLLGPFENAPELWEKHGPMGSLHLVKPNSLKIIIDCGTEDPLYGVNLKFHQQLRYKNIPHEFVSRPGKHEWAYWRDNVKYQILYFSSFFYQKNAENK